MIYFVKNHSKLKEDLALTSIDISYQNSKLSTILENKTANGQLISERNFGVFKSSKNQPNF